MTDEDIMIEGERILHEFIGWKISDVFGLMLCGLVVAARKLGMSKLQVQEVLVKHWDQTE